ncbi:MAG: DUF368 domain-containing protein [Bacteroidales bacterium]|nr:DUF368 domain-containing protein [Bacteroidales bacterium]
MGAVNVVPVSSGAVSLILGVYERFINSIRSLNHKNFRYLSKGEVTEFARRTDIRFFSILVLGLLVGMVFTSIFLKSLLKSYEVFTWSFFIGLILASVYAVMRKIEKVSLKNVIILVLGFAISFVMSLHLNPVSNDSFSYMFLCGIIGATGTVVPGISGSHLMLLMGNYELIVTEAIPAMTKASTFMSGARIILPFLLGCLVSIVSFSYLLSWLMREYRNETLSALSGFMLGSLPVVYPWKEPSADMMSFIFHLPTVNGEFFGAILMAALGVLAVYVLEQLARKNEAKEQKQA